jgi:two-component system, NtrC family, sensor kinase
LTSYVLFVDDEPENLAVFEAACADRFAVLTANSGAEGLALLAQHEVAVILADQRMPGMTGLELLERARHESPQTLRMLVTAYSDLSTAEDAINRGHVRRYLRKPWNNEDLCATLADGIETFEMNAKLSCLERRLLETERVYSLGVIAAGLARELKTPVSDAKTSVSRARERLIGASGSLASGASNGALRARLAEATEDLAEAEVGTTRVLDVVRGFEIPTLQSDPDEQTDLSHVLRLTLRLLQGELRASTSLELDVRQAPPVIGSSAEVGQVLLNLLIYALRAMDDQPRDRRVLSIGLRYEAPWVRLDVADTGAGLSGELISQIFEPFSPTGLQRGSGLGLAISRSILERIGGSIHADNRPTGGVLFRVRLRPTEAG